MNKHIRQPVSPILSEIDCYLFDGPGVDPFLTVSLSEAQQYAHELNSDRQKYAVVRFNASDGLPLTSDFAEELANIETSRLIRYAAILACAGVSTQDLAQKCVNELVNRDREEIEEAA
jgi:hypothetical protein